jgi:hypothetical protein
MSVNKGSGAGGKNTNKNGLNFEKISDSIPKLLDDGFIQKELSISKISKKSKNKFSFYLEKIISNKTIIFLTKNGLKEYFRIFFNIDIFRQPDEAFLIKNNDETYKLLILEKKHQNTSGSVSDKLGLGTYFVHEYTKSINNPNIVVEYAFCLSNYLKSEYLSNTKKYDILRKYNVENNIKVFFGEDLDYHQKIHDWIYGE